MSESKPTKLVTWPYSLRRGITSNPSHGVCAMAAVAWVMEHNHHDHPECACPVISRYVILLNDGMPLKERQCLLSYLPRISGSRSVEHEKARAEILARGAVRVLAPMALDSLRLPSQARKLRDLAPDCTMAEATQAALGISLTRLGGAAEDVKNCSAWAADSAGRSRAESTMAAKWSAKVAVLSDAWDEALTILDEALSAGPQGGPWTEEMVMSAVEIYRSLGGGVTI